MSETSNSRFYSAAIPILIISIIAAYTALDSIFLRVFPGQRALYAGTIIITFSALLIGLPKLALRGREVFLVLAWVVLNTLWFVVLLGQKKVYLPWVIGDAITLLQPLMLLLVAGMFPKLFTSRAIFTGLAASLFIAAFLAFLFNVGAGNRFDSPSTLLFAVAWVAAIAGSARWRVLSVMLLLALAAISFKSGERTAIILWLIAGLTVYGLSVSKKQLSVSFVVAILFAVLFGPAIFQSVVQDALQETRFSKNLDGELDGSLLTRVNEATDVFREFRHAGIAKKLIGHGHGAAFRPVDSLTLANITAEGLVHHVHIGPALVLYRYGIFGILVLGYLWYRVLKCFLAMRAMKSEQWDILHASFTLALFLYLIDFFLRNVMSEPVFSYTVAGFLFLESRIVWARPVTREPVAPSLA